MQSATAVQPQPQQAGQGGANYPMASLYVGDLGNILLINFSLLFVLSLLPDRVPNYSQSWSLIRSTKSRKSIISPPRGFLWIMIHLVVTDLVRLVLNHDFDVENESQNFYRNLFYDFKT